MPHKNPLNIYSKFVCFSTLFLIFAGGMVTSTGSGLAVPDWPLSYGMLFPPMVGGVFYEHGHRMIASFVGLLTVILALWLAKVERRKWVRTLGWCALAAVIIQGLLGGITVLFFLPTPVSVMHATLAQTFFVLTVIIAYTQSTERGEREGENFTFHRKFFMLTVLIIVLIYTQLILGAVMRHTGSGLAIPDFPTMGGSWLPLFDKEMLFNINDWRFEHLLEPVIMSQVIIHFIHRLGAVIILISVGIIHFIGLKYYRQQKKIRQNLILMDIILAGQIVWGILTVLSGRDPFLTSLHVANGALFLGFAFLLLLRVSPLSLKGFA